MDSQSDDNIDIFLEDPEVPDDFMTLSVPQSMTISELIESQVPSEMNVLMAKFTIEGKITSIESPGFSKSISEVTGGKSASVQLEIYKYESSNLKIKKQIPGLGQNPQLQQKKEPVQSKKDQIKTLKKCPTYQKAVKGINLKFECQNQKCDAFKKNVICKIGLKTFNPMEQYIDCKCPACGEVGDEEQSQVVFFECQYQIRGKYKESLKAPPVVLNPETWEKAKDNKFVHNKYAEKKWIEITIEAKSL